MQGFFVYALLNRIAEARQFCIFRLQTKSPTYEQAACIAAPY